ncbi:hypothetical protein N9B82_02635 [Saprospiraceae bacterium]|nr:hypothetical protein [Saprospiraceae bacterium]
MKKTTTIKFSRLRFYKKDNISCFREKNDIKREEFITANLRQFKLKNNTIVRVADYYEYKIDDKDFSHYFDDFILHKSESTNYSANSNFGDINVGCIGPYGYFWDRIRILLLLRTELNIDNLLQEDFVLRHFETVPKEEQKRIIESIAEESKNSNVILYHTYGDEDYPVKIVIDIKENVSWKIDDPEYKQEWIFNREEYFNTLNTLLEYLTKEWLKTYG